MDLVPACRLHEAAFQQRPAHDVVVLGTATAADGLHAPSLLDEILQLPSDGRGALQGCVIQRMLAREALLVGSLLPHRVGGQQAQVVAISMQHRLGLRSQLFLLPIGSDKHRRVGRDHGNDAEHLRCAAELQGNQQAIGIHRVDGKHCQLLSDFRQRVLVVQRTQPSEQVRRLHQGFLRRTVHKGKIQDILDAESLELQVH
mmetsp:Transcript_35896/g.91391  ORF Transcript_35896/g.91391 Transcript_35896/m.91391 type:complete len:201 (-) Transcript_35896:1078-1680(-)